MIYFKISRGAPDTVDGQLALLLRESEGRIQLCAVNARKPNKERMLCLNEEAKLDMCSEGVFSEVARTACMRVLPGRLDTV